MNIHSYAWNIKKPYYVKKLLRSILRQAKEMVDSSRKKQVFLMEALWSKFLPQYQKLQELIAAGELGEIRNMLVEFWLHTRSLPCHRRLYDPGTRRRKPAGYRYL